MGREEHCKQITGVCGECSQCFSRTGFIPAHSVCAFLVYTSQALGCSAGNCLRWALGCMHFPCLSCSGSGSQVLHKGTDSVGPAFCACPRSEHSCPQLRLIASPIQAARFSGCTTDRPSQVCLCLFWGADLWLRPFRWMLTIQNPKKSWLATKSACSLV